MQITLIKNSKQASERNYNFSSIQMVIHRTVLAAALPLIGQCDSHFTSFNISINTTNLDSTNTRTAAAQFPKPEIHFAQLIFQIGFSGTSIQRTSLIIARHHWNNFITASKQASRQAF